MSFQKLIDDMQTLAKSSAAAGAADDAAIKAAAADSGVDVDDDSDGDLSADAAQAAADAAAENGNEDGKTGADEGDKSADGDADDKGDMTKSFSFTLDDGTVVEAMDGTELVKAMMTRMSADKAEMVKALGMSVDLIKSQAAQIETMAARITSLSSEGRGRKTAVSIAEKVAQGAGVLQKSQLETGVTPNEFFAKADVARVAGRVSYADIRLAETYLNKGQAIPTQILQRVLG